MPRNMSFALTIEQIKHREKTVTRRIGWGFLKAGDIINAVEKTMGLKKGEQIKCLSQLRIVSVRQEPLNSITQDDVIKEGFNYTPQEFVDMLIKQYKCQPNEIVNRIEFEYI